jgi:hypothetical protein
LQLTAQELRGKRLVDNPAGGNSATCHIDQVGVDGSHPLFTDFNFQAVGVPRNPDLRATQGRQIQRLTGRAARQRRHDRRTAHTQSRRASGLVGARYRRRRRFPGDVERRLRAEAEAVTLTCEKSPPVTILQTNFGSFWV